MNVMQMTEEKVGQLLRVVENTFKGQGLFAEIKKILRRV